MLVTEIKYGIIEFLIKYAKKLFQIKQKIMSIYGAEAFEAKSQCIRARIGEYLIPNFKGMDTSQCTEFDDIIISLFEITDEHISYYKTITIKVLANIMILSLIIFLMTKVISEWKIYKNNRFTPQDPLPLITSESSKNSSIQSNQSHSSISQSQDLSSLSKRLYCPDPYERVTQF
ncbi:unnamed protein product [Moneuplotes crassus]|uniref:Uncharacterized protein n=1 Tax=Euplotes crassus TaxID=5936 RepID=A0AAD1Y7Z8_EUPCR|nr:unnamed protein product [Moneuplotes crassus]